VKKQSAAQKTEIIKSNEEWQAQLPPSNIRSPGNMVLNGLFQVWILIYPCRAYSVVSVADNLFAALQINMNPAPADPVSHSRLQLHR